MTRASLFLENKNRAPISTRLMPLRKVFGSFFKKNEARARETQSLETPLFGALSPPLQILGAGGHAKVATAAAESAGFRIAGVFDDRARKALMGHAVVGGIAAAGAGLALLAIGDNAQRARLARARTGAWAVVVHARAWVHGRAHLGEGTLVCAHAVAQPDARLGRHVILNTASVVEHDVVVGDFAHVAPGAVIAGGAVIGEGAFIGAGAVVTPGRRVGAGAVIGAGAVVVEHVPDGAVWAGVPARPLAFRRREQSS